MDKLKTAVLGLNAKGRLLLDAASKLNLFELCAVADRDSEIAQAATQQYNCRGYDDYRQLIIQDHFDCLIVAAPVHTCDQYIKTAIKNNFHILMSTPPARNFEEFAELVSLAEKQNVILAVANINRFEKSFHQLHTTMFGSEDDKDRPPRQEQQFVPLEPFLVTALCLVEKNSDENYHLNWKADPKLAGGGVLLHDCFEIIDQIIYNFGIPQQAYCLNTNTATDRQQRHYLTEDTIILNLKFSDNLFANIIAGSFARPQKIMKIYSKNKIISLSDSKLTVAENSGETEKKYKYNNEQLGCASKMLENFALRILCPDKKELRCNANQNLINMAVIEAAYLSARTGFPEEPEKILNMSQLEHVNIWNNQK